MSERGGFAMPPAERAHELLLKCDRSRDGVLQADEFTRFFKVVVGSALKKKEQLQLPAEAEQLFSLLDD